jgi:hypothetical protein
MAPVPLEPAYGSLHALRRPWRRRAWALLVTFALLFAGLVHVAHSHDAASAYPGHKFCAACAVLERSGGAPPPHVATLAAPPPLANTEAGCTTAVPCVAHAVRSPCCPRAPPPALHP